MKRRFKSKSLQWGVVGAMLFYSGVQALALPGFYDPQAVDAPKVVKRIAPSVFEIFSVDDDNFSNLSTPYLIALRKKWMDQEPLLAIPWGSLPPWNQKAYLQLKFCEFFRISPCVGSDSFAKGTAFSFLKPGVFATAFHVINSSLRSQYISQYLFNPKSPRFNLVDFFSGRYVMAVLGNNKYFNSPYGFDGEKVVVPELFPFLSSGSLDGVLLSYPSIKKQIPVLQPSPRGSQVGDKIYFLGYPVVTSNRRGKYNAPDSDGQQIYYTKGKVVPLLEKLDDESQGHAYKDEMSQNLVVTDADCERGMSGGPAFNEQGQIVGITKAMFSKATLDSNLAAARDLNHLPPAKVLTSNIEVFCTFQPILALLQ
jgi:hypothetical protein